MKKPQKEKLLIAISGASGAIYAENLIRRLSSLPEAFDEVALIFTENGKKVWVYELEKEVVLPTNGREYSNSDLFAPPASGSANYNRMIIIPCSMGMLGRIAHGVSNDLVTRAADVILKERRSLLLVTREMPYSLIHIRNMEILTLAGAIICPASPAYYSKPVDIQALVETVTDKVISLMGLGPSGFEWGKDES